MSFVLYHSPGQVVNIVFETLNSVGVRADGYANPIISRIIFPNLSLAAGYPQTMSKLDTGLFSFSFTLPTLASAVGSYIVDLTYFDPDTGLSKNTFVQVAVTAPIGQYTATTF